MVKLIIGLILIVCGIVLGAYVGIWICFVGGIIDVINEIRADELSAVVVAIGVAKVLFANFIGFVAAIALIIPGAGLISTS